MKYAVTFCATDEKAESNPMWHACVLFSKIDEESNKLEVVDNWGFYGLPSTGAPDSLLRKLKLSLSMDVDLSGNHGKWRHEETRFLDRGEGLHGRTFELTEEQFLAFQKHFRTLEQEENAAITEIAAFLNLKPKAKPRIYAYEDHSPLIFAIEKLKAKEEGRKSRLNPFGLSIGLDLFPPLPHIRNSDTCKSQALSALRSARTEAGEPILSKTQVDELTAQGKHPSVPRFSGPKMEDLRLHSTGPLAEHTKKSGKKIHFRNNVGIDGVRLFWTLPPQNADFLTKESAALCKIDSEYTSQVISLITKLQRLEWVLYDAMVPEQYKKHKENLINALVKTYEGFAKVLPKRDDHKIEGWYGWGLGLLSLPRSAAEHELREKMGNARSLLNSIYMAIVDGWHLEADATSNEDDYEAVAAYLEEADKKAICKILGRNYLDPHSDVELSADDEGALVATENDYLADDERARSEQSLCAQVGR
ncbi:hypothetical protein [Legionella sp. km772]|uniref:hypothetical protein n=1 Tax=Legionella sp. km772 TaxID=2498111 RepID=UPI001F1D4B0E|nr:hypothetical protein [Legionella sp. km772]